MTEEQHPGGDEDRSVGPGRALDTLRIPSFLPFWLSNVLQFLCFQVQSMTMQWLITSLTDSRTALGAIGFVQGGTMAIASPVAGVVVDRFAKRKLLILGRVGLATLVLCISAGVVTEQIELWHLAIAAMIGGLLAAVINPATQTYVFDLVGRDRVQGAVALNATGAGFAQTLGPALGGVAIAGIGIVGTFVSSAAGLYLAALILAAIPVMGNPREASGRSVWSDMREGFSYVRAHPPVALALFACSMAFFNGALGPMRAIFARHVLDVGSVGFGGMSTAAGLGTIAAALTVAWLPPVRRPGLAIAGSMFGFALCLILYSFAFSYAYILGVEFLTGAVGALWNVWTISGIQLAGPSEMRGRIISLVFMLAQLGFVGQLLVGVLADQVGDQLALAIFGGIPTVVLFFTLLFGYRTLREL